MQLQWKDNEVTVFIPADKVLDFAVELEELLSKPVAPVAALRRAVGRLGWAATVLPHAKWAVARMWGALADKEKAAQPGLKRSRGGDFTHLIHTCRFAAAAGWLAAFWRGRQGPLVRKHSLERRRATATVEIVTDASPFGLGGYVTVQGQIFQWFSEPLTAGDAERFRLELGAPDGQCTWEALAFCWPFPCGLSMPAAARPS